MTVEVGGSDEILDHVEEAWTGDLDGITERGFLRVLTVHNPLYFIFDGDRTRGLAVESPDNPRSITPTGMIRERSRSGTPRIRVVFTTMMTDQTQSPPKNWRLIEK